MKKNKKLLLCVVLIAMFIVNVFFLQNLIRAMDQTAPQTSDESEVETEQDQEVEESIADEEIIEEEVIINEEIVSTVPELESGEETVLAESKAYALQSHEIIVYDYAELKSAIATANNGKTTIYFGADIIQGSTGTTISPTKANIIIDGTNPDTGNRHTYTEYGSLAIADTIKLSVNPATPATIELRNLNVVGQNYYGTVMIEDAVKNARLIFNNVNYVGPQITFHHYGTTVLKDSVISIGTTATTSPAQEVGEVYRLEFEGANTINHQITGAYPVFNFLIAGNGVTVKNDADVKITTTRPFNTGALTNFDFRIEEGAKFSITQTSNTGILMNGIDGTFEVGKDSSAEFIRKGTAFNTTMFNWQSLNSNFNVKGKADFIAETDSLRILNVGRMNIDNGTVNVNAKSEITGFLAYTTVGQTLTNGHINMAVNGRSLNETNGFYQDGVLNATNNSSISLIADKEMGVQHLRFKDANFIDSSLNLHVKGRMASTSTSIGLIANNISMDNSIFDFRYDIDSPSVADMASLIMKNSSKFHVFSKKSLQPVGVQVKSAFTLAEGNEMKITFDEINSTDTLSGLLRVNGALKIEPKAVLHLVAKTGTINGIIQILGTAGVTIDNPKSVLLYGGGGLTKVIGGASSSTYSIEAQQINTWLNPLTFDTNGTLDAMPLHMFRKKDYASSFRISGVNGSSTTVTSTNYETADGTNPSGNFSFLGLRTQVISIGELWINGKNPIIGSTNMKGNTEPNTEIRFEYEGSGNPLEVRGTSNQTGSFTLNTEPLSSIEYLFKGNTNYLYYIHSMMQTPIGGDLSFVQVPSEMRFGIVPIPSKKMILNREVVDWKIDIEDTRGASSNWELLASLSQPLTPADTSKPIMSDALVYVNDDDSMQVLGEAPILVGESVDGPVQSSVSWANGRGILLQLNPGAIYAGIQYRAIIHWTLQDAP